MFAKLFGDGDDQVLFVIDVSDEPGKEAMVRATINLASRSEFLGLCFHTWHFGTSKQAQEFFDGINCQHANSIMMDMIDDFIDQTVPNPL